MKQKKELDIFQWLQYDKLFVVLGLVFGIMLVFVNPPFHTNDENDHFYCAYHLSKGILIPQQGDGIVGGPLPVNLKNTVQSFQGIPFFQGSKLSEARVKELSSIPLNEKDAQFFHNPYYGSNPIAFIPHAAGIAIGKSFKSNPVWLGWFGRLGGLFCFIVIIFFAIRLTPVFKSMFFLYALTPMILYQAASVTYDMLNLALTFLIIALALKYALTPGYIMKTSDFIVIILVSILFTMSKGGYPLIPLLFFLIPPSRFGVKGKYIIIMPMLFVFFGVMYFLPSFTWSRLLADLQFNSIMALKKDFHLDPVLSQQFVLSNPAHFIDIMIQNVLHFREEWAAGCIGRFGYSYTLLPTAMLVIHGLVLIAAALVDSNYKISINIYQKILLAIVGFGTIALIIGGSYIFMSPVGASMIFGLQGRYFAQAVVIILLLLYNTQFDNSVWRKWGPTALFVYMAVFLTYTVIFLDETFYIP